MSKQYIPISRRQKVGTLKKLLSEYLEIEMKFMDQYGSESSDTVSLASISSKKQWPKNFRGDQYVSVGDFERYAKNKFGITIHCVDAAGNHLNPDIWIQASDARNDYMVRRKAIEFDTHNNKNPRLRTKCTLYDVINTLKQGPAGPEDGTYDGSPWYFGTVSGVVDNWFSEEWFIISKYLVLNGKPDEALFALILCSKMSDHGTDAPSYWHQMARIAMAEGNRDRMGWAIEKMENVTFIPYDPDPFPDLALMIVHTQDMIEVASYCLHTLHEKEWARRVLNHMLLDRMEFVGLWEPCFDELSRAFLRLFGKEAITEARIAALMGFQWGNDWVSCAERLRKLKAEYILDAVEVFEDRLGFPKRPSY